MTKNNNSTFFHGEREQYSSGVEISETHPTTMPFGKYLQVLIIVMKYTFLQFDPAPRRGKPEVTRRTPDYFL